MRIAYRGSKAMENALKKRVAPEQRPSAAEEQLAAEPMETKRAAFIKAAIESVAVYHSLNGYADSQGAFFSVMKREGFDVLAWLREPQP